MTIIALPSNCGLKPIRLKTSSSRIKPKLIFRRLMDKQAQKMDPAKRQMNEERLQQAVKNINKAGACQDSIPLQSSVDARYIEFGLVRYDARLFRSGMSTLQKKRRPYIAVSAATLGLTKHWLENFPTVDQSLLQ